MRAGDRIGDVAEVAVVATPISEPTLESFDLVEHALVLKRQPRPMMGRPQLEIDVAASIRRVHGLRPPNSGS
jgi:hypothetical protein